ncbi:DUF1285 domain-containing protein [Litoreibacter arenae]|uniref:Proteophosphoglycan n=1 Tax=Litoreibacter arenae DSM 19593 TaxID=1123360 RepID=S9QPU3_9RHOB|nr:DUF1285 domain-containing protein [Litoreibacter arenae]EPX81667.1 Proteophosphoglycan precursor [Litoreibacter arenae DSM 19593]
MAKGTDARKVEVPSAENIAAAAQEAAKGGLPPVDKWNPPFCGDLDMRIARDGTWFYLGTPIGRAGLVKLFSSIIRKDGDDYFLVTPVEKVGITVEDAPFVALDFDAVGEGEDQKLRFETHVGDRFTAGPEHPIRVTYDDDGEPSPYVLVRRNLEALIDRKSFYRLVDLGVHRDGWFGVWSDGEFFPIIRSEALEA